MNNEKAVMIVKSKMKHLYKNFNSELENYLYDQLVYKIDDVLKDYPSIQKTMKRECLILVNDMLGLTHDAVANLELGVTEHNEDWTEEVKEEFLDQIEDKN